MAKKVLIIGESCKDIFNYGNCDRLCPDAPVPVFNGTTTTISDGMAMNVLHNLESLGIDCCIITNKNWQLVKKSKYHMLGAKWPSICSPVKPLDLAS